MKGHPSDLYLLQPLKPFHCFGVFPVEVLPDRREQRLPAVADFGVPVLLLHYRQIPCQPCRLHMIEPQVVGGEAELPRHGVEVVVIVHAWELVEQRHALTTCFFAHMVHWS